MNYTTRILVGALARPILSSGTSMKVGRWERKLYNRTELYGKTLAILGLDRIRKETAMRMKAGGMKIVGYDPITSVEEAECFGTKKMELDGIMAPR